MPIKYDVNQRTVLLCDYSKGGFKPLSREAFLLGNNLLLLTATFAVLMGTLYPLLGEALDIKVSIRAAYFNSFFVPLTLVLMAILVPGMLSNWKRQDSSPLLRRMLMLAPAALIMGGALWAGEGLLDPWLTGAMLQRYVALALLVGAGVALYGLASFVTGAYRLSDIKALMRRKSST